MQGRPLVGAWPPGAVRLAFLALASALLLLAATPAPAAAAPKDSADTTVKITPFPPSVQVDTAAADDQDTDSANRRQKRRHARISIDSDKDFESFKEAMETAPWIVGLVFLVVGSIFLTPVILLIGIVWYKLRKTRLQNDALLKLAERGVVSPAQAVDAVGSGIMPAAQAVETQAAGAATASGVAGGVAGAATAASAYQQAIATRKRAVWSDLRKGVLLGAIGLSIVMYSMIENGSANWLGLALLFVGVAYVILWWLEDRHITQRSPDKATD